MITGTYTAADPFTHNSCAHQINLLSTRVNYACTAWTSYKAKRYTIGLSIHRLGICAADFTRNLGQERRMVMEIHLATVKVGASY